jgi:hypothetical protein
MDKGFFFRENKLKSSRYEEKNSKLSYLENRFQQVAKL